MIDYLIIGAGFSGSVLAERIASQLQKRVLLVDKRNHVGGNAFDHYDEHGILIHKYGPHIFHTNSKKIVHYLSKFTKWRPYFHQVLSIIEGKKVPIPFNLNSIYQLFPPKYAEKLENELISNFGYGNKISILKLRESSKGNLKFLADYIYENVFLGYNAKQWELKPEELDPSVTGRVPIFISRDDRYFQDIYQLMPADGYSKLFEKMLSQKNIQVLLQTDYKSILNEIKFNKLIFTGPIDEFFEYQFGELPYRSLKFEFENHDLEFFQETGQINYSTNNDYTRITEFKHLTNQSHKKTTIAFEYPEKYIIDNNIPYYPIANEQNNLLFKKYLNESQKLKSVIFCGRLAEYKYYNMDQIIARATHIYEKGLWK